MFQNWPDLPKLLHISICMSYKNLNISSISDYWYFRLFLSVYYVYMVYQVEWRNALFMYMPFLRYLLPKCLYCHVCVCACVCSHAYVNITFVVILTILLWHSLIIPYKNLWDLFYCVPSYNSCAKHELYRLFMKHSN